MALPLCRVGVEVVGHDSLMVTPRVSSSKECWANLSSRLVVIVCVCVCVVTRTTTGRDYNDAAAITEMR